MRAPGCRLQLLSGDAYHNHPPAENGDGRVPLSARRSKMPSSPRRQSATQRARHFQRHIGVVLATIALSASSSKRSKKVPISSTNSMTGHLLAGRADWQQVHQRVGIARPDSACSVLPPTINLKLPIRIDLDYVQACAQARRVRALEFVWFSAAPRRADFQGVVWQVASPIPLCPQQGFFSSAEGKSS